MIIIGNYTRRVVQVNNTLPPLTSARTVYDTYKIHEERQVVVDVNELETWEFQRQTKNSAVNDIVKCIIVSLIRICGLWYTITQFHVFIIYQYVYVGYGIP